MKAGRPQAKDLPDIDALRAIAKLRQPNEYGGWRWVTIWDFAEEFPGLPDKVVRAKVDALDRKGLIYGCGCGCRGDIELTPDGEAALERAEG